MYCYRLLRDNLFVFFPVFFYRPTSRAIKRMGILTPCRAESFLELCGIEKCWRYVLHELRITTTVYD